MSPLYSPPMPAVPRICAELVRRAAAVRAPRIEQPHRSGATARARRCRVLLVRVVAPPPHAQRALVEASLDHDEQLPERVGRASGYRQGPRGVNWDLKRVL